MTTQQTKTQAERIFERFGGVPKMHAALNRLPQRYRRSRSSLYRWNTQRQDGVKGSNGVVPTSAMPGIIEAALKAGFQLRPSDFDPRPR